MGMAGVAGQKGMLTHLTHLIPTLVHVYPGVGVCHALIFVLCFWITRLIVVHYLCLFFKQMRLIILGICHPQIENRSLHDPIIFEIFVFDLTTNDLKSTALNKALTQTILWQGTKSYQAQHDHAPIRLIINYQLNCVSEKKISCMLFKFLFTFLFKVTQAISLPIARPNPGLK